jgi:hypothetical protein
MPEDRVADWIPLLIEDLNQIIDWSLNELPTEVCA